MRCRACGAVVGEAARFCDQCGSRLEDPTERSAIADPPSSAASPAANGRPRRGSATRADRPARADANAAADADGAGDAADAPGANGVRDDASASPGRAADGSAGDRRIVTALFADLVDYVRLVAEHDPEEVRRRVDAALVAMVDAIERYGGTREKFIGDAVFAVFGWPTAHDDDALRAAHCALAIRDSLRRLEDPSGEALQVRIGVATDEVVAAPRGVPGALDWSLTGPAVTTAARIQGEARPGEILLDEPTRRAARKALIVDDLGERLLRGQRRPVRLVRLFGDAGFQPWHPPAGRLIGRVRERDTLRAMVERLRSSGVGGVAVVVGEAGIGKSRLLSDVEGEARRAGLAWSWVDNVSYGVVEPYRFGRALAQTVADEHGMDSGSFVRRLLFTDDVDPADVRRWAGAVAAMARDAAFSGWEAEAELVLSDPREVSEAIRSLARAYVERLLDLDGPRVIVVDDLHWLDRSSGPIFEELVGVALRAPLVLLVGSREEGLRHPSLEAEDVTRIDLAGLDERQTGELAGSVARAAVDADDARRLFLRTGGNPLFIGETVRAIVDEGGAITRDGRLVVTSAEDDAVPATLRALLGSRIDALSPDSRAILRVAAVLGMSFRETTIEDVLGEPVEPSLYERLAEAAMIVPSDAEGGWRFCHPLIHDAAYRGLLTSDRATLHARVADRIESRQPNGAFALVARHRAAAGDAPRAIPLLRRAADQALSVGASEEAARYLEAAAALATEPAEADELRERATAARGAQPVR